MQPIQTLSIHKFGGSCLKDSKSFEKTLKIVEKYKKDKLIFVCSALSNVTDFLLEAADGIAAHKFEVEEKIESLRTRHLNLINEVLTNEKIKADATNWLNNNLKRLSNMLYGVSEVGLMPRFQDFIASFGERLSTYIYYCYLKTKGKPVVFFSGDELIYTNTNALPIFDLTEKTIQEKVEPILQEDKYPVMTGYIAADKEKHVTTLGRGGSDLTATLLAYSLHIPRRKVVVILWKDVDGLLTANPKLETKAKLIQHISYAEAREMAYFGSKILHPLCIFPLEKREIPILLRNFDDPDKPEFTTVEVTKEKKSGIVKAISVQDSAMITVESDAMVSLPGTAAKVFEILGGSNVNVIMISQGSSENNITFLVEGKMGEKAKEVLRSSKFFGEQWFNIKLDNNVALLAIVGAGMAYTPGVAGRIFSALGRAGVNVRAIAQGSSEINISVAIESKDVKQAVHAIHEEFQLGD
jgi:aspartate kinase